MIPEKIKVLHIIKSLGRGGAEMLLPETLKLHDQNRFEFHYIYFLPWKDQLVDSLQKSGGRVTCLKANNNFELLLRVRQVVRYLKTHDIRLIHAHLPWAGIVARMASRLANIPVLYTEHNKQERYHIITRTMNLFTMNWLSAVVAVSDDVASSIRKHKRKLTKPLHTILNGVNAVHFDGGKDQQHIRNGLGIEPHAIVIGTIAVFRLQKRLDIWLDTAAKILSTHPDVRFIIVGDGPSKDELHARCQTLGLAGKVHFAGLQQEVRPYLAAMNIFMISSRFEGLPIALLEAMAFSLPIVTTDAGGIKQVVRHNIEGLMCPVEEPERLSGLVLQLLADHELRKTLGFNSRQRVVESFSLQRMVDQLERLYLDHLALPA